MTKTSLILDCDPGVDDAVALLLAFARPDALELLGVTTVAGNVGGALTLRNARLIREIAGREDVPVIRGSDRPIVRAPVQADHFHGASGLGDFPVFEPKAPAAPGRAADFIVDQVMSRPSGSVSLAVTGPMTNLAAAILLEPAITERLGTVVIMGGARSEGGNVTASAEFNVYADAHAAHIVLSAVKDAVVLGLDATHQVRTTRERAERVRRLGGRRAEACATLFDFCLKTWERLGDDGGAPLHDPCVIAWLLQPDLFMLRACRIEVETGSPLTMGHTAVEFRLPEPEKASVRWAVKADGQGVFDLLAESLAR